MLFQFIRNRLPSAGQKGVTMVEYALIAALIAVVAIIAIDDVGQLVNGTFQTIKTEMEGATG